MQGQQPTPWQLQRLNQLCQATGQRYSRPRTLRQAAGRIRDLEIRQAHGSKRVKQPPQTKRQKRKRPSTDASWDRMPQLLSDLSRLHYTAARAVERGESGDRWAAQARSLERLIDRIVEAPIGS